MNGQNCGAVCKCMAATETHLRMGGSAKSLALERWTVLFHTSVDNPVVSRARMPLLHVHVHSLGSCCWPAMRGVAYAMTDSKFVHLHLRNEGHVLFVRAYS